MKKYSVSPLMIMFIAAFVLIDGSFTALLSVLAAAFHEAGHILALLAVGAKPCKLSGSGIGISLKTDALGYKDEIKVVIAGPVFSLFLFLVLLPFYKNFSAFALSFSSLVLFVINILPIYPLDGGRALYCTLALKTDMQKSGIITRVISCIFLLPLFVLSVIIMITSGYNLSLLIICIYLLALLIGVKNI